GAVPRSFEYDLRAVRQFAHDFVKHMRRHRGRTARRDFGRDGIGDLEIEIGCLEAEFAAVGLHQHVCQNWNGVTPLDHAMDVAQRLQKFCTLDGNFHGKTRFGAFKRKNQAQRQAGVRGMRSRGAKVTKERAFRKGAFWARWHIPRRSQARISKRPHPGDRPFAYRITGGAIPARYSCNCRLRISISSANAMSLPTRPSILRTAWRTRVWSRPPKRRPISGNERRVKVFARYIATWRGRTTFAVRRDDSRSERLTLYWRATTRWMSSILTRFGSCGRIRSRTSRSAISSVTAWPVSLLWASRRLSAPSRSRPLWVMVLAMKESTGSGTSKP